MTLINGVKFFLVRLFVGILYEIILSNLNNAILGYSLIVLLISRYA